MQQHYVPQFYLKKFARNTKPRKYVIKCFNKSTGKNFTRNIKDIAMENYFYDNQEPPIIEDIFASLESPSSQILNKIIEAESIENLTDTERTIFSLFIFFQYSRTQGAREFLYQVSKLIYKHFEEDKNYPKIANFDPQILKKFLEDRGYTAQINIMFGPREEKSNDFLKIAEETSKILFNLEWNITKNRFKREFYTSDHPVFIYSPYSNEKMIRGYGIQAFKAPGVEIFFPLTPKLCLIIYDKIVSKCKDVSSERYFKKEELDWINTQIIAESYRLIFTKGNDFQFVKQVLKEYPELKNIKRNRIYILDK